MANAQPLYLPLYVDGNNFLSGSAQNHPLQSSTDSLEFIFQAKEAATITDLGFLYGARTGTPPTYRISLQGVTSGGRADGAIKSSTNAKITFTPPPDTTIDGKWQWKTLTSSYTCTRGELLAIVIDYSSGTANGSNNSSFTYSWGASEGTLFPYSVTVVTGTGTYRNLIPSFGYKSSSLAYGNIMESLTFTNFSSDSSPDERALFFQIPSGWTSTYQLAGIIFRGGSPNAGKTFKVQLYTGTTVLQTITVAANQLEAAGSNDRMQIWFNETSLSTLTPGTSYRVGIQPQEVSNSVGVARYGVSTNTDFDAWPLGRNCYSSYRTDAGAWTDVNTERINMALILYDLTSSGSGGLLRHPGTNGGLNG